jgi:hypothetical protein
MRLNIITEDSVVNQVRESFGNKDILKIPLSPTGENPATHWFCTMAGSEEKMNSIYAKKNLSIMELGTGPKEFLQKWNLKIIK